MRRLLVIVLLALLPLQWSGAAAAVRCLHGEAGHAHGARGAGHPGHSGHSGHAGHDADASHGPDRVSAAHEAPTPHVAHHGHVEAPGQAGLKHAGHAGHAGFGDCGLGDCDGCCQGTGTPPPVALHLPQPPSFGAVPASRIDATPASPTLDGPFRPPRSESA
jgi:hypothetical protein